jgi:hypothetical protein
MSYITYHMQDPFLDWNKYLTEAYSAGSPFASIKTFHPEDYGTAQAASPGILVIYRSYADKENQGGWIDRAGVSAAEADKAADEYIVRFRDSVNQHMGTSKNGLKFAESLNEEYPTDNIPKLKNIVAFDRAFVRRLPVHCPGLLPVVFAAAVGNPDHDEYVHLVDLAKETAAAGGAFGYHAYTSVYKNQDWIESAAHQRDLHLRWDVIDKFLVGLGIRVKWFLGEGGPIKSNPDGYSPSPVPGWKHGDVYGGSVTKYIDHLRRLDSVLAGTLAAKDGRLLGLALFTKPGQGQWDTFDLPAFEIKEYVKANPSPPPVVIDPDPGGDMDWKTEIWAVSVQEQIDRGIPLNPDAGLQQLILDRPGYTPVHRERSVKTADGIERGFMAAEDVTGQGPRLVFVFKKPWSGPSGVEVIGDPGETAVAAQFAAPVGTDEERAAGELWNE